MCTWSQLALHTGKWTVSCIALFYLSTQSVLYNMPHSCKHFFLRPSAFYLTFTLSEQSGVQYLAQGYSAMQTEASKDRTTSQLIDDLLYVLSYSRTSKGLALD